MNGNRIPMTKRHALALAAALTLAVGTGAAAVAGLAHPPSRAATGRAIVARPSIAAQPSQAASPTREDVD